MFNSNNTPFTMPVMPATGNYADGAEYMRAAEYHEQQYERHY